MEALLSRTKRGAQAKAFVPNAVRVEAGWDRRTPGAAAINRLRVPGEDSRSRANSGAPNPDRPVGVDAVRTSGICTARAEEGLSGGPRAAPR